MHDMQFTVPVNFAVAWQLMRQTMHFVGSMRLVAWLCQHWGSYCSAQDTGLNTGQYTGQVTGQMDRQIALNTTAARLAV